MKPGSFFERPGSFFENLCGYKFYKNFEFENFVMLSDSVVPAFLTKAECLFLRIIRTYTERERLLSTMIRMAEEVKLDTSAKIVRIST